MIEPLLVDLEIKEKTLFSLQEEITVLEKKILNPIPNTKTIMPISADSITALSFGLAPSSNRRALRRSNSFCGPWGSLPNSRKKCTHLAKSQKYNVAVSETIKESPRYTVLKTGLGR